MGVSMKPRGRPKKTRIVEKLPKIGQFSPRGRPGRPDEVELSFDQFEAVRLVDYFGLDHKKAGSRMDISRQTVERILKQARNRISDALVNGKIIKIFGGKIHFKHQKIHPKSHSK